jgi:6-phosphogluconate dehydrogenase
VVSQNCKQHRTQSLSPNCTREKLTQAELFRYLSAVKHQREAAETFYSKLGMSGPAPGNVDKEKLIKDVRNALYASKICSYAQVRFVNLSCVLAAMSGHLRAHAPVAMCMHLCNCWGKCV